MAKKSSMRRLDRNENSWPGGRFRYEGFQDFISVPSLESGLHTIQDCGEIVDFHYTDVGSEDLAIFFHGAVPGVKIPALRLPIFSGLNISLGAQVDRLMLSDATMAVHQDLRLGWFSGTKDYDFSSKIDLIIEKILNLKPKRRIILLGGSQGGFAALRASLKIPNSIALVWNPQTKIKDFFWSKHLTGYLRHGFGVENFGDLPEEISHARKFDLTQHYSSGAYQNYVFLMQNIEDGDHFKNHAKPIYSAAGGEINEVSMGINSAEGGRFILALGDWVGGHSIPDRSTIEAMAGHFFRSRGSTQELFESKELHLRLPSSFIRSSQEVRLEDDYTPLSPLEPSRQTVNLQALSKSERKFLLAELDKYKEGSFVQYGVTNLLGDIALLGFKSAIAIDQDADRVSILQEKLNLNSNISYKNILEIYSISSREEFVKSPLLGVDEEGGAPDAIYIHDHNASKICANFLKRLRMVGDSYSPKMFIFMADNLNLEAEFQDVFCEVGRAGRIVKFELSHNSKF